MSKLLEIQPKELRFTVELKKQSICSVRLTNVTNYYVAFKVKTTSPKRYCVRPNVGIIMPNSACDFTVVMQMPKTGDLDCKDKFLIQSTTVSAETTDEDITASMFVKVSGNYVEEKKLKVILVDPIDSPTLSPINGALSNGPARESSFFRDHSANGVENLSKQHMVTEEREEPVLVNIKESKAVEDKKVKPVKNVLFKLETDLEELKLENDLKELERAKYAEEKQSAKNVEDLKPAMDVEEVNASNGVEELFTAKTAYGLQRTKDIDESNPAKYVNEQKPAMYIDESKPAKYVDEQKPVKYVDDQKPVKYLDELKPAKYVDEMKPAKYVDEQKPAKYLDELKPAKYVDELEPAKDVEVEKLKCAVNLGPKALHKELEKDVQLNFFKDTEESNLVKDVEEIKLKLSEFELKLSKAEFTISKLMVERNSNIEERKVLQEKFAELSKRSVKNVQVGFPLLFVCMVALTSIVLGYRLHP